MDTEDVSKMQEELALEPVLNQATIDADLMMQKIVKKQQDADARKAIVSREEKLCNEQRENAEKMKMECERSCDCVAVPKTQSKPSKL